MGNDWNDMYDQVYDKISDYLVDGCLRENGANSLIESLSNITELDHDSIRRVFRRNIIWDEPCSITHIELITDQIMDRVIYG